MTLNEKQKVGGSLTLENIDLIKYLLSIVVILVHIRPFLEKYPKTDYIFNTGIGRICVPFFFFVSGFLVSRKHMEQPGYIMKYIKGHLKSYLLWSLIYLPLLFAFAFDHRAEIVSVIESLNIPMFWLLLLSPLIAVAATLILLLYSGTFYHLWYFPALFLSLLVIHLWRKKWNSIKVLLVISFLLLLFGSTETYWGLLSNQAQNAIGPYFSIFYTTRNFLFFGLFYVAFGYAIAQREDLYVPHVFLKLVVSIVMFSIEVWFLMNTSRKDSNILVFAIPVTFYLFSTVAQMKEIPTVISKKSIRGISTYLYLLHPYVIFFVTMLNINYVVQTVLIIVLTHVFALMILKYKEKRAVSKTQKT